jgi:peptide/nickel transport system substrate-binding protein
MKSIKAFAAVALASLLCASRPVVAAPHDQLVIGIAQFPSTLHPNIDAELVKAYALGFVIRQITAYDKDWKNSCLLCAELPTIENGLAKIVQRPDGSKGMAVTIKLRPGLKWGDGEKVTAKDVEFTWRLGRDPKSGFSNTNPWSRAERVDVVDESTAVLHLDKVLASYNDWDQILPAHIEAPVFEKAAAAGHYVRQTTYARAPATPGCTTGPILWRPTSRARSLFWSHTHIGPEPSPDSSASSSG